MSSTVAVIQSQIDALNAALPNSAQGVVVVMDLPGGGQSRVEMAGPAEIIKALADLERKLGRAQRSASGRYGMSIKTASFN